MKGFVIALLFMLTCRVTLFCDAATPCDTVEIGATDLSHQTKHESFLITGVVVTEWTFECCGVISAWEVRAAASGDVQFQVWDVLDESNREAMMLGANDVKVDVSADKPTRVDIDVTDQIPVRPGYAIGWQSINSDTIYYAEGCDTCSTKYFLEDLTTKTPDTYALWETHQFKGDGQSIGQSREYAVKVHVHQGATPVMLNVPSVTMVRHSDYIGYPFIFVDYWDDNEMDEVFVSMVSIQPDTKIFDVHGMSGRVRATSSLATAESEYTMTVEVTDGCLTSRADLTIKVRLPPAEGICTQGTQYGILDMGLSPMLTESSTRTAVLATHPYWEFDCCGIISSYEIVVAKEGDIELQLWQVTDVDQRMAEMIGFSTHHLVPNGDNPVIVEVAEDDRIPLEEGYSLGWLAVGSKDLIKYVEDCDSCTLDYFFEEVRLNMRPIFYNPGLEHSFSSEGYIIDKKRAYAIRAIVEPGPLPAFENLPDSVTVEYDAKVGDVIYSLKYAKTNSVKFASTMAPTDKFTLDSSNGELELAKTFAEEDESFEVFFEISDGCQSSTAMLTIRVMRPPQKGVCYPGGKVGTSDISIQDEMDTESRSAFVVTDAEWQINCNGILTGWELRVGEDCDIELQVWGDVDLVSKQARLKSTSTHHVQKSEAEPYLIELSRDHQVPITEGDVIGWLGSKKDTLLHTERCRSCTESYLVEPVGVFSPFTVGDMFTFSTDGYDIESSKDFAIKAVISSGSAPEFTGTASTFDVVLSTLDNSSSSVIWTFLAVDEDANDIVTYSMVSIDPNTDIFVLNSSSGVLTLEAGKYTSVTYKLGIHATDGAYITPYELYVKLVDDKEDDKEDDEDPDGPTSGVPPSPGFFQTLPGYVVLGVIGLIVLAVIVAVTAVWVIKKKKSQAKFVVHPETSSPPLESMKYIQREHSTMTNVVVNDDYGTSPPSDQMIPSDPQMQREMSVLPSERVPPAPLLVKPAADA